MGWNLIRWIQHVNRWFGQGGGGVEGNRTPDLLIANEALYQLSYNPALQPADHAQDAPASQGGRSRCAGVAGPVLSRSFRGNPTLLTILYEVLQQILGLYWWVVILAAVMSNLIAFGIVDTRNRLVWTISDVLYRITEPALRRIRAVLPNFGGIDLSPLVLLLLVFVARSLLARIYTAIAFGGIQQLFL